MRGHLFRFGATIVVALLAMGDLSVRADLQNAVFRGETWATSIYNSSWTDAHAVDGNTGTGWHTSNTGLSDPQHMYVDLGALIPIDSVEVVARSGFLSRLNNCEVSVYESADGTGTPVYTERIRIRSGVTQTFRLAKRTVGRSVKVERVSGTDHINLMELRAYSDNLAQGKPTELSTTYSSSYPAWRAADGTRNTTAADIAASQVEAASYPWWKVDLEQEAKIDGILLYNRNDASWDHRLADLNVQVLADDGTTVVYDYQVEHGELINTNDVLNSPQVIPLDLSTNNVQGRYVKVIRQSNTDILQLSEVEVYGTTPLDVSDYAHRMKITFGGYSTGATLTNFPALVKLGPDVNDDFAYSQFASANGSDLRFADSDGETELHYEIENWDTNGTSAVWVCVPELESGGADFIWAYWGSTDGLTYDADTFDPDADISDCIVWLDGEDVDGAGNMTLSDGGVVATWVNKATTGSVGDFAASGLNDADPTFVASSANFGGKPAVRLNGNDTTESVLLNAYNFAAPCTVIYVSRLTGTANYRLLAGHANNWLLGYLGGTKDDAYFNGWVYNGTVAADTATYMYTAVIPAAGNSSFIRNGAVVAANTSGTTGPNGLRLGGGYLANNEHASGEIVEMLVYNRALTDEERNQVGAYLQSKYALTTLHSDPDAPAYTRDGSTWDVGYSAVWHLNDSDATDGVNDSAAGDYDGINSGTVNIAGQIGGARDWPGDNSVILPVGSLANLSDQVTLSLWVNGDASQPRNDSVFEARNGVNRTLNSHLPWSNGNVYWDAGYSGTYDRIYKAAVAGDYEQVWNHWVFTKNVGDGTMRAYLNGVQWHSGAGLVKGYPATTTFRLGSYADGTTAYRGSLDEFRVSLVERSADWIKASFDSQSDNASFMTYEKRLAPSDFERRMKIVFEGYDSGVTLTNFPAVVRLGPDAVSDFSYGEFGSFGGGDLRFTDSDGVTVIPYEVEKWDRNGTSVVWVQVPELESTGQDYIWAYWGNTSLLDYDTDTFDPGDVSDCQMWLDADVGLTTNGSGTVTSWADQSGNGRNATLQDGTPVETKNALNGHSVVTFDPDGNSWFSFSQMTDIRTVFWVIKEDTVGTHFLLGDNDKYHFHRNGAYIWANYGPQSMVVNGTTRLMGTAVDGRTTQLGSGYRLVSVVTTSGAEASRLSEDRTQTARSWDGDVAELIIYNRALTDGEESKVGHYLARKYGFTSAYPDPNAPTYTRDGSTWTEDFGGVWHMADPSPADSTGNGNYGAGISDPTAMTGAIGDGVDYPNGPYTVVGDADTIDPPSDFTASVWFRSTDGGGWYRNLMGNFGSGGGGGTFWGLGWMALNNEGFVCRVSNATTQLGAGNYNNGAWHHMVGVKDGDDMLVYVDGTLRNTGVRTGAVSNAEQLWFARHGSQAVDCSLDEARIATVARSADWIRASHANQASDSSFVKAAKDIETTDFNKRMKIVFSGYTAGTTLTNFPALVAISEDVNGFDYSTFASSTGSDLRFADSDGVTPLNFEIENWDTNGTSAVWVQVPELEGSGTDYIWAYWGNTGVLTFDAGAFDPGADISDCLVWLDGEDIDGQDNATLSDGGVVASWVNKAASGSVGDFTASGSNDADPTFVASSANFNNKPTVRLNGNDTTESVLLNAYNFATPCTVIYVSRLTGTANYRLLSGHGNNWLLGYHGGTKDDAYLNGWVYNGGVAADTATYMYTAVIPGTGNSNFLRNGELVAANTGGTTGPNGLRLGGGYQSNNEHSSGEIVEVLVYGRVLTDEEENRLGYYLASKYDLTTPNYSDPNAPTYTRNGSTWDDTYAGVYHLNAGNYSDSSANGRDAAPLNGPVAAAGQVAGGTDLDGSNDFVDMPNNFGIFGSGPYTVSHWLNSDNVSDGNRVVFCAGGEHSLFHTFGDTQPQNTLGVRENDGAWRTPVTASGFVVNRWYYFSSSFDTTDGYRLHLDGALTDTDPQNVAHGTRGGDTGLGALDNSQRRFDGTVDETRISNVVRSDDWQSAVYETMANNTTFATYSAVIENGEPTAVTRHSADLNGTLHITEGLDTTVKVFWGTTDGGASYGGWEHTNTIGLSSMPIGFQQPVSGLVDGQRYYYRFYATNDNGEAWATVPMVFITMPTHAADMEIWFAADTVLADQDGTLASWRDLSGNGRHGTQGTVGSQPTFQTSVANGRPVVRFDGSDDAFAYDGTFMGGTDFTIIMVEGRRSTKSNNWILGGTTGGANQNLHLGYRSDAQFGVDYYANAAEAAVPGYTGQEFKLVMSIQNTDGGGGRQVLTNGVVFTSDANQTRLTDYLGAHIGGRPVAGNYYNGDIAEFMVFSRALSATEMNEIGHYLGTKYGITTPYEDDIVDPADFAHKRKIQVTGYTGSETLVNFPVLVKFEGGGAFNYADCASASGNDLRFALDGTDDALAYDIDLWDTNGESIVWVTIPALTNGTTFWAYWGNASQTDQPYYVQQGGAWAADYGGVWHLNSGTATDSTRNSNTGTAGGTVGVTFVDDGKVGRAADLPGSSGTGGRGYVSVPSAASIEMGNTFSVSAWVTYERIASNNQWERMFSKKNVYNGGDGWEIGHVQNSDTQVFVAGSAGSTATRPAVTDSWRAGQWIHVLFAYDGANVHSYANGQFLVDVPCTAVVDNSGRPFVMGNNAVYGEYNWDGKMDEVRLANAVRSADWVKAEYDAVANYDTFVVYDDQVTVRAPSDLATTSATLNGDLAWTDGLSTEVQLVYGTNDAGAVFGSWDGAAVVATVSSPTSLVYAVSGLQPSTIYHYRFRAANSGETNWSHVGTFRTRFADVSDLALWWDASEIPGATNNGPVTTWKDWSGNGKDGTQAVGERGPTLLASGLNGQSVVRLDGSDDGLYYDGSLYVNTDYTLFIVEGRRSPKDNNYLLIGSTSAGNQNLHYGYRLNAQFTHAQYGNDYNMTVAGYAAPEFHIWASTMNSAQAQGRRTFRDGVYLGGDGGTGKLSSYRGATLGTWPNTGRYFDGDIAEYIVFDRALSPDEQNQVGAYLADKYGMAERYQAEVDATVLAHSVDITFDNYGGSQVLTNFPVRVELSEGGLPNFLHSQFASTNGYDLRFTLQGETDLLSHEVELWNTSGISYVWVRIPAFTNNTTITAYWGNPSDAGVELYVGAAGDVWDWQYENVLLMATNGTETVASDSSRYIRNGVMRNMEASDGITGVMGGAVALDGANEYITVSYSEPETEVTQALWVRTTTDNRAFFSIRQGDLGGSNDREIQLVGGAARTRIYNVETITTPALNLADGSWHYIVHTFGASIGGQKLYVDGTEQVSGSKTFSDFNWDDMVHVGYGGSYFAGDIGDCRVASTTRSADWVLAEYNNIANYNSFVTEGAVQGPAPYVRNDMPTLVIDTNATANGYVCATGDVATTTWLYWGDNYHETSGWENTNNLGVRSNGVWNVALTNLAKTTTYYYRFFASNVFGSAWGEPTTNFTTLDTYFVVTPGSGPNGSINPSLVQYVSENTDSVVFTFPADYGYHLTNVLVDGSLIGVTNQYQFLNVTEAHSITSYYGINYYDITVVQDAGGLIEPTAPLQVMHGDDSQVFTITPDNGYFLTDVRVDGVSQGLIDSYQFTSMQTNHTIAAYFEAYPTGFPMSSVAFWVQADDLPYTNGQTVAEWYETSHTNNMLQPSLGLRGIYVTNGINGRPAVNFNGSQSMTNVAMNSDWPTDNATIFVVAKADTVAQASHLYRSQPWLSNPRFSVHLPWNNGNNYFDYGNQNDGRMYWGNAGTDADSIWCLFNENGVRQAAWQNGALKKSETTTGTWNPAGYSFELGATYQGNIGEVIIFNTALNEVDRNRVGYYLQEKYGLTTDYVDPNAADIGVSMDVAYLGRTEETGVGTAVYQGEQVQYTITVTNNGPTNVTGVAVTDLLSGGVSYASHSGGSYVSGSGLWTIGAMAYQGSVQLTLTATVDADVGYTTLTNTASLTAINETELVSGNNSAAQAVLTWHDAVDLADYANRVRIDFPGFDRAGVTLTNFPVLVKLNTGISGFSYDGFESALGADMRFTESDQTTVIAHEVEKWDSSGDSYVWVRLPTLTVGTHIWVYWGNAADVPAENTPTQLSGCVLWLDGNSGVQTNGVGEITTWEDQSGQGHHADTVTGNPGLAIGPEGNPVVNFDGDDYLNTTYDFSPAEYTIFAVSRSTDVSVNGRVISSPDGNWLFGHWSGYDERFHANGWVQNNTGTRNLNWQIHAGSVNSSDQASFWKNGGPLVIDSAGAGTDYQPHRLGLGGWNPGSELSRCEVAEVIIYDRVLSDVERLAVGSYLAHKYGLASRDRLPSYTADGTVWTEGYAGVWHLHETSGSHFDSTPNRRNGTGVSLEDQDATGLADGADRFGGVHYVSVPYSAALEGVFTGGFTLSAWGNHDGVCPSDGQPRWLADIGNYGDNGAGLYLRDGGFWGYRHNTFLTGTTPQQGSTWYQMTLWHDLTTLKMYIDAEEEASGAETGGDMTNYGLRFGAQAKSLQSPRYFDGVIDEVRLSSVTRTTNWIWAAYVNMASNDTFVAVDDVHGKPQIENVAATYVGRTNGQFNADLISTNGLPTSVWVFWDTNNHGTVKGAWGNTNVLAGYQAEGDVYTNLYTLEMDTTYHYAFYASNSYGDAWAQPSTNFQTASSNEFAISAVSGGGGTITPSGVEFVTLGQDSSNYTFQADTGYTMTNLLVDGASVGTPASYQFTNVDRDHTIQALFGMNAYAITVTQSTGGTIVPDPATPVSHGDDSQEFTITPLPGYYLVTVVVDGGGVGQQFSYQFTNVTNAHTITATFAVVPTLPVTGSLGVWYAADAITATNGEPVAQWIDLSGNNRHATQATADNRPGYTNSVSLINGKPAITLDSVNDGLTFDGSFLAGTDYTVFFVEGRTDNGVNYLLNGGAPTANNNLHIGYRNNTTITHAHWSNDYDMGVLGYGSQQFRVQTYWLQGGTGRKTWLNGALVGSNGTSTYLASYSGATIGGNPVLGNSYGGQIAEMVIYTRALSDAERKQVWSYLETKYRVQGMPEDALPTGVEDALLWVSANDVEGVSDGGTVSAMMDMTGRGRNWTQAGGNPVYREDQLNSMPAVYFDGTDSCRFGWSAVADIRTVFWVVREVETPSGTEPRFLLGDAGGSTYHFHRASAGGNIWNSSHAPLCFNGTTKLRGFVIDGRTTDMPTNMSIISVRTSGNARANSFSRDRNINGRGWHGDMAEVLMYNRVLSDAEEAAVGEYLVEKYKLRPSLFIVK